MKKVIFYMCLLLLTTFSFSQPIQLHPDNPHYFLHQGKPLILITSAEHYGAVFNLDFDYEKYLNTLAADGLNYTRIFTGSYIEKESSFGIKNNTLAPKSGRVVTPWARSETPGYINGGNKFDLDKWDDNYFKRLKNFITKAQERNIIVEVTLFSSIYMPDHWVYSPLYTANNINQTDSVDYKSVNTPDNGNLFAHQESMVRKLVNELNGFDNIFYEIQNEPWADQTVTSFILNPFDKESVETWTKRVDLASKVSLMWQDKITSIITDEESMLFQKHLIAQNYCNFKYPVKDVNPAISIMNFHYAWPEVVDWNYGYNRVIGFDESGFAGSSDDVYRQQAWNFILAGGGVFNNLDYSFYPGFEDGTGPNDAPGGGSAVLRAQLKILQEFMSGFDFIRMQPDFNIVVLAPGVLSRTLAEPGKQYAVYLSGGEQCDLIVNLPNGRYRAEWVNTKTGVIDKQEQFDHTGGRITLKSPDFKHDIALRIKCFK